MPQEQGTTGLKVGFQAKEAHDPRPEGVIVGPAISLSHPGTVA
jgi:hypothetical protein